MVAIQKVPETDIDFVAPDVRIGYAPALPFPPTKLPLDQHYLDEYNEHDPDECELCLETNHAKQSRCDCGKCCERLLIEASLRDAEREPRIAQECGVIIDDHLGQGPKEVVGYLLNRRGEGDYACRFYDRPTRRCTIYETRPLVCRLFDCDGEGRQQLIEIGESFDEQS